MVDLPHTSPQPTRGDGQLKINFRQLVWYVPLWPANTIGWYQLVASLKSIKSNPLTCFPLRPRFRDILEWSLDRQRHLAIILVFFSFVKWLEEGVKFLELLRWKLTGGPKPRRFRKRLANLHQKIKKWSKTWGAFSKLLRWIILNDQKVLFLWEAPPRLKYTSWTPLPILFCDRKVFEREILPKQGISKPQG